jgi:hypothetical protein
MRLLHLSTAVLFSALSACSSSATHEVTLLAPISEPCNKVADPGCQPTYFSCADLSVTELRLAVGVFDRQVTTVPCPDNLQQTGSAAVQVSYQPGANFYMIDASFPREGEIVYIAAGPFPENQAEQPWQVLLR